MSGSALRTCEALLAERLAPYEAEARARKLQVHRELDPDLRLPADAALDAALATLLRFVFETTPDGCPIYLASMRSQAPVARLCDGRLVLRWQVSGAPCEQGAVRPIRPRAGDAISQLASRRASQVRAAFEQIGWPVALGALSGGRELMAEIECRGDD